MLCKRIGAIHKKARERLESLREASRAESERLLGTFGEVLAVVREALTPVVPAENDKGDPALAEHQPAGPDALYAKTGRLVLATLERSGGVDAVAGSEAYANFMEQLLPPEECEPLVAAYCQEAGLPAEPAAAVAALRT